MKKKVFVGLSGGVDSSVSALLLKRAGYDVTGVYIKGWQPEWVECTWKEERLSAMRTAAYLDIPFLTLDGEETYKKNVAEYMLAEYAKGRTPNGDMLCNREVKFGIFLNYALQEGADFVATGHYAQVQQRPGGVKLFESVDRQKDQTYFLSQLSPAQLQRALFPIGHLEKSEVRKLAQEAGLPVATRKDSQGICFVGDMSMEEWLMRELHPTPGNVLNMEGEIIGSHGGALLYTIGQRHGFIVDTQHDMKEVLYVVSKDIQNNTITVGTKLNDYASKTLQVENVSFVDVPLAVGEEVSVQYRYRGEKVKAVLRHIENGRHIFELDTLVSVASGQFAVFYKGRECLGGGVIA